MYDRASPVLARLKDFSRNLAIYGLGDIAPQLISFLLLPIYTRYLTTEEYGILALLLIIEAPAKILFRWGIDTAFMRFYYDCADDAARQRLASTVFGFLFAANGILVAATILSAGWLSQWLFGTGAYAFIVTLTIANTFIVGFYFIPFQVLRIKERSGQFISLTAGRAFGTIAARLLLVVGFHLGFVGIVVADVLVTAVFTAVLARWFRPLLRMTFSWSVIREALAFGLPRIPHSIGQHVIGLADRFFLNYFKYSTDVIGLYSMGATFGLALKMFLSSFEFAWTPFFLGVMKQPDAKDIYAKMSTYVIALLVLLGSGLCVTAADLVRLVTTPQFHAASVVTPWIALGAVFQGTYLVTSIGLIITKRTRVYPIATGLAALTSIGANWVLVPRYGMLGAAWANAVAYGALAAVTAAFSWQAYPIPYEWQRLARVVVAGGLAFLAGSAFPVFEWPLVGVLARGATVVTVFGMVLAITGFFHRGEWRVMTDVWRRVKYDRTTS